MSRAAVLLLALGLILAGCGWWAHRAQAAFAAAATRAEGTVIGLERRSGSKGSVTYAPVVEFQAEGATHRFASSMSSSPPAWEVGERVVVLYAPGRPDDAMLDSWIGRHLLSLVLGLLGAVALLVGTILFVAGRRARGSSDRMAWPAPQ